MKKSICTRHSRAVMGAAALFVSAGGSVHASDTASQNVNLTVTEVNEISLGGATVPLTVGTLSAGTLTGTIGSTYSITTNSATSKKITAQLGGALTSGLTLSTSLQAPSTGVSPGSPVALSTTAVDVVNSIEPVSAAGLTITYTSTATVAVAAGVQAPVAVTYTIVNDS